MGICSYFTTHYFLLSSILIIGEVPYCNFVSLIININDRRCVSMLGMYVQNFGDENTTINRFFFSLAGSPPPPDGLEIVKNTTSVRASHFYLLIDPIGGFRRSNIPQPANCTYLQSKAAQSIDVSTNHKLPKETSYT